MNAHLLQNIAIAGFAWMASLLLAMPIDAQPLDDWSNNKGTVLVEPGIVNGLITWIAAKTEWIVQEPPSIHFISHARLVEMYSGKDGYSNDLDIRALYSRNGQIIYLSEKWNPNNLSDRSVLLHELVHHLQMLNNIKAKCLAAYDRQAFNLQLEWLREQGIQDPYKFLDIDEFTIRLISQCPA